MGYSIILSAKAKDDIRDIYSYIDGVLCDRRQATGTYRALKSSILSLGEMPKRRSLVDDPELAERGIRALRSGRYLVFYLVQEVPPCVVVVRVLHERREWRSLVDSPVTGS